MLSLLDDSYDFSSDIKHFNTGVRVTRSKLLQMAGAATLKGRETKLMFTAS
jgi:hypothetical protein